MKIGITDTLKPSLLYYVDWLKRFSTDIDCRILSHVRQNLQDVNQLDGLLLTGGGDVDPLYYDVDDSKGKAREVSRNRDEFEFNAIELAIDRSLPILGICRGMQVMNVYLGGTLILDLPSAGYQNHSRDKSYAVAHQVKVDPNSLLSHLMGSELLEVNSSHHQAVGRLGNGLMSAAVSPDGVIEGAEWILKDRMPFLMLVQWHPERMAEFESPASKALGERFLKEVQYMKTTNHSNTASHLIEE